MVFALFILSSTAFDGLRATQSWFLLFWLDPTGIVTQLAGSTPVLAYEVLRPWYLAWEGFCPVASPFVYLAAYSDEFSASVRIPRHAGPRFRRMSVHRSAACRSSIPPDAGPVGDAG